MRLFLRKLDKNIKANETRPATSQLPYFELVAIPEEQGGEWIVLGTFWKKEKGYSGQTTPWTDIHVDTVLQAKEKAKYTSKGLTTPIAPRDYPVNNNDIAF